MDSLQSLFCIVRRRHGLVSYGHPFFREAADQGNAVAQLNLGAVYEFGRGVSQDDGQAVAWYLKAANQGNADAQASLGSMYRNGRGVRQDDKQAVAWYRKAADQGNTRAQVNLGFMYESGRGVLKDYKQAIAWYRKAAERGNAVAQRNLGFMYLIGSGVPQDDKQANARYRKAADQGDAAAQSLLGTAYENGDGVPKDYKQAVAWYRKAADQGDAIAQASLGRMYEDGRGVPQNYVLAYMWFNLAAATDAHVTKDRDRVGAKMISTQIAQAQAMSERCLQSDYKDCESQPPSVARREDRVAPLPAATNKIASTGTGFFASENGYLITNAHVVDGCRTVRASGVGTLSMIATDEESDLALYVSSEKPRAFARLRGGRGARTGEAVVAIGFPLTGLLSTDPIVTTGIISALSGIRNDRRTIQITAPVQPGNSGGPLLGENGSVVGVVVGKLNAIKVAEVIGDIPQNVNFAVSLGTLQSFLNANGVPYKLDDSNATKPPADIAAEVSRYTVLLECLK